jgi:DNA polymerase/3'-5' exonuclease PolX
MNIEQKMAYIRRALELGADIDVKFHCTNEKEKAEKVAAELSEMLGIQSEQLSSDDKETHWFKIRNWENRLDTVVFYNEYLVEDVDLNGMESEEHVS